MSYINKENLLIVIEEVFHKTPADGEEQMGVLKCHRIVREAPTADVVEVVRCKDCVFAKEGFDKCDVYCNLNDVSFGKDSFCSYGERREGNEGQID